MSEESNPSVLFVCVHKAGRSQTGAGWLTHLAGDRVVVPSTGSAPAIEAMREIDIDITTARPKIPNHRCDPGLHRRIDLLVTCG